jgi:hypothetical protein
MLLSVAAWYVERCAWLWLWPAVVCFAEEGGRRRGSGTCGAAVARVATGRGAGRRLVGCSCSILTMGLCTCAADVRKLQLLCCSGNSRLIPEGVWRVVFPYLRLDVVVCLTTFRALTVHANTNRRGAVAGGTVCCAEENTYYNIARILCQPYQRDGSSACGCPGAPPQEGPARAQWRRSR